MPVAILTRTAKGAPLTTAELDAGLSALAASAFKFTAGTVAPAGPGVGDRWYDTNTATLWTWIQSAGGGSQWADLGNSVTVVGCLMTAFVVAQAAQTIALQSGINLIAVSFNGAVALTLTGASDCIYEVARVTGTAGAVTITQG